MKRYGILLLVSLALLSLHTPVMAMIPDYIDLFYVGQAFPLANGTKIRLTEKVVSADCIDTAANFFYIQETDYSAGIRVVPDAGLPAVARNQRVTVIGRLDTVDGERRINAIDIQIATYPGVAYSLAMDAPAVGGSDYNADTPGITYDAAGPYNKGLLITIWGRVGLVDSGFFYVDDGSQLWDDYSIGIRVHCNNQTQLPVSGQYVVVTGVCSSYRAYGYNYRLVLPRDNNDIVYPTPETVTSTQALGPLENVIGIPCVPFFDSDDNPSPYAYYVFTNYDASQWSPSRQNWTGIGTVYSDDGYHFINVSDNARDPANPATITYTGIKSVIEQKARYIPLYAAELGSNWIGYPYSTGVAAMLATVVDGALSYPYHNAASTGMVDAYCHQFVNGTQREERMDVHTGTFEPWHAYKFTSHGKYALILPNPGIQIDISDPPPYELTPCTDYPITATVRNTQGTPLANYAVTFYTNHGEFTENGSTSVQATTNANGVATVHFYGSDCNKRADVFAQAYAGRGRKHVSETIHVFYQQWKLTLMLSHCEILSGHPITATARLDNCDREPVANQAIELTTTTGDFTDGVNNYGTTYTAATAANGEITIDLALTGCPVTATVTAEAVNLCTKDYIDTEQVTTLCQNVENDDWPMFMHDPQHTGLSSTWDDMTQNLQLVWSQPIPCADTVRSNEYWPVDGVWHVNYVNHPQPSPKYVLADSSSYIFEHPFIDSSPVAVGSTVVVGAWSGTYLNSTGYVRAFNAATNGSTIWTASGSPVQMGGVASTPCIYNGLVFVGSADGKLYCLDLATGQQYWANQTTDRSNPAGNSRILSSPVVHQGKVYIINETSRIYAFTADTTGSPVAGYPVALPIEQHLIQPNQLTFTGGSSSPAIAVVNNIPYLLVGCDDGYLYRLRLTDRNLQMIYLDGCVESSPSISTKTNTGFVGVSVYKGEDVVRFSIEPFKVITTWRLQEESRASVSIAANGCVYNGVDTGTYFYKLDADAEKAQGFHYLERYGHDYPDEWYFVGSAAHTRSVGEGLVYTGNDNGRLYELGEDRLNARREVFLGDGFVASSPAISYNVDAAGNRWVFITGRGGAGDKIHAFRALK